MKKLFAISALAAAAVAAPAGAATLDAISLLRGFNNIVLGDLTANAETEGALFVGGKFKGNGATVNPQGMSDVDLGDGVVGSFIVGGDQTAGANLNNGAAYIGGSSSRSLNMNSAGDVTIRGSSSGGVSVNGGDLTVGGSYSGNLNFNGNGDIVIGGSFASNANLNGGDMSVGGAVAGNINNNGGTLTVGGPIAGSVNSNNGGVTVNAPVAAPVIAAVPVADVAAAMTGLAADLAALADTGGVANITDQNNLSFVSVAGADGVAVFNVSASFLQTGTFHGFTADPGVTTIVNVSGSSIAIGANLNNTYSNVLFNFFEAQTLNINSTFNVSILAPLADVRLQGGGINGTVVSGNLFQGAEIRPSAFTGNVPVGAVSAVPLPASGVLLLGAMGLLGYRARRRAA